MTNNQIIQNEAARLDPATLHQIASAHHTPEQIAALAAQIIVTEDDGTQHPGTVQDAEIMLAAGELHTYNEWRRMGQQVKKGETHLIECHLWQFTTKPSKAQREAAEAEGKEAAEHPHFYPTKAHLFSCLQVESSKPAPAGRFSSTAEIIAYNKKLAAERKAKAAAAVQQPTTEPAPEIIPASVADKKPGGWKKCSFYTICTTPQNPANHAEKRDGYTDGVFNYYALRLGKATIWYAVHPAYGVSIGHGQNSRNAAKATAFELLDSVAKMEKNPSERLKSCAAMVAAAQNA